MYVRRGGGGHDDIEEDEAKMGFIFQINEHGFGTQLHEEKGQKKGPNHIDYFTLHLHYLLLFLQYSLIFYSLLLTHMHVTCSCNSM